MFWKACVVGAAGFGVFWALSGSVAAPSPPPEEAWEIVVLGVAQDAGIPHLGCQQTLCQAIRAGERKAERVASLGLVNRLLNRAYLFDATPDLPSQVHSLTGGGQPDGIFLTHAHIGHYTGLMYLGRESVDVQQVPVYGSERMAGFLTANGPWSLLVTRGNIDLRTVAPDQPIDLGGGVTVTPFLVPHRDEFTDTFGYLIVGPHRRALFIPDIDQWQKWDRSIGELANTVDYAFLDGSFSSADEIPGRSTEDIPHPMMPVTRALVQGARAALWFIHINHTNPQFGAPDVAKDGQRFPM